MFRIHDSGKVPVAGFASRAIMLTVLIAMIVNICSLVFFEQEYRLLDELRPRLDDEAVGMLRREVGLQIALAAVVLVALLACAVAVAWFRWRNTTSQQTLRQVKMLAHNILASMDQGVVTIDRQGMVTSINSAAIQFLGVDFECVGGPLSKISFDQFPLIAVADELITRKLPIRDREFAIGRNGRSFRYRVDARFLSGLDREALGCVLMIRDVTERALLEQRMARMERFISLGTLASGLHHEIKNPLTALSLHVQLLEEHLHDRNSARSADETLCILKTEIHRLNGVLESFRNFAALQHLSRQPADIVEIIENAVRLISPQATDQDVRIALLHPETELPKVAVDEQKFEQAVLNLLINALEAMPDGGTLSVSAFTSDCLLFVEIVDTGVGIPDELQQNIFKPYFSTKSNGTGMGLALTEKLIGQHGGQVDYETSSRGTTFRIRLPIDLVDQNL